MMAFVSMVFGLAPAIAPILGGWMQAAFGWRSIFWFIASFTFLLLLVCLRLLPESLERSRRHAFHPSVILTNYWQVGGHVRFLLLCVGNALTFCGVSIYIGSASPFVYSMLHLSSREFAWLFIPLIGGMTFGSMLSTRASHRLSPKVIIGIGYAVMLTGAVANVAYNSLFAAAIPWAVLPIFFYCVGMSFGAPAMSMRMLEMFPRTRGLVSSLMSFVFMTIFTVISGVICPLIFDSALHLAEAVLVGVVLSAIFWRLGAPKIGGDKPEELRQTPEEFAPEL
jgi:DHA1 family bicyclomycin/chloramphenicol resistance-like MFS transporter